MNTYLPLWLRKLLRPAGWAYGLFWSWNIIFLAFMLLGFAPTVLPEMIVAVQAGEFPPAFLLYALILTLIPAAAVLLGLTVLRRSPGRLFALGYGVEGPLLLILVVRFFVVRQLTPAVTLLLVVAGLGIAAYLWQILDRRIDQRGALLRHLQAVGLTLLLLADLYASAWLAFYPLPIGVAAWEALGRAAADFWQWLGRFDWRDLAGVEWRWLPFSILGIVLAAYTATLFLLMPLAVLVLYLRAWWAGIRGLAQDYGLARAAVLAGLVLAVCVGLFIRANQQPQHRAFALLKEPPASPAQAQALLDQQATIRAGLLNAYLAPQRYLSVVGDVRHVSDMYEWALDLPPGQARKVQHLYELVARPILYSPAEAYETDQWGNSEALRQEPRRAALLYEQFFDRPIVEAERDSVVKAVRATWDIDQARTGWLAVDDREVHLLRQEVILAEHGDWADGELYEVYQNRTGQRQEVVYYFSLPESAVITGLWLGHNADRDGRFAYRVAPRGAAQAVYRNEVNYNRDPALVEQIGPRQYRLRIFPIEPQGARWDESTGRSRLAEGPPLHLWLTWRVLARDNAWPLPRLAEKRNVYWDGDSVRLVNGEPMAAGADEWLPASVPATGPVQPQPHQVTFPTGDMVIVTPAGPGNRPELPADLRLAVVLDRSRSMAGYTGQVRLALSRLAQVVERGGTIDLYLTASPYRGEAPSRASLAGFDPGKIVYYGGQNAAELLAQFQSLQAGQAYAAVFVLTDNSGYELSAADVSLSPPDAPIWLVHLDGRLPLGYDDGTLEAVVASGGGVAGSVEEALDRLAVIRAAGPGARIDLIDGYTWSTIPTLTRAEPAYALVSDPPGDGFAALAGRWLIVAEMVHQRGWLKQLDTLDTLHAIAVEQSIVTPYSSMIVLVEQRQQRLLDLLETGTDRFKREQEEIGETVPDNPFNVTGVPEPEEWLLLALAAGMLAWHVCRRLRPQCLRCRAS